MLRIAGLSPAIEAEGETLFAQWQEYDEALTWHDFLLNYASHGAVAYMREIEAAQAYASAHVLRRTYTTLIDG